MYLKVLLILGLIFIAPEVGAINFWLDRVSDDLKWNTASGWDITLTITSIISFLAWFLYFIGVVLAIYGGFLILISAGDEEKVKKWKTIILYVAIGLIVIFLAANIVSFVISALYSNNSTDPNFPAQWANISGSADGTINGGASNIVPGSVQVLDPNTWNVLYTNP